MDIQTKARVQLEIQRLEQELDNTQGLDRLQLLDEQLELKKLLQGWKPPTQEEACPSCSG